LKKSMVCNHVLSIFLVIGIASLVSSCDDVSQPGKETGHKELEEAAEEGEELEAVKEAMKKKEEENEKEGEERKEKGEERKSEGERMVKASPGMRKR
jgi:hypothetical protein